jgi:hypothetical protein
MGRDPLPLPRERALIRPAAGREIGLEEVYEEFVHHIIID